jgi:hypothetical protein
MVTTMIERAAIELTAATADAEQEYAELGFCTPETVERIAEAREACEHAGINWH